MNETIKQKSNIIYKFTLYGRVPSKKNSRINTRSGKSFPSTNYQKWHRDASWQLAQMRIQKEYLSGAYTIELYFTYGDKRIFDYTNKAESINDLLVDNHIIQDDNIRFLSRVILDGEYNKGTWETEIILREYIHRGEHESLG